MKTLSSAAHATPVGALPFVALALLWSLVTPTTSQAAAGDVTYTVRQTYEVADVPAFARQIRGWFWMPEDGPEQKLLDFRIVEGPDSLRVTRDPQYGRNWLYAEAAPNPLQPLRIVTEFTVTRQAVSGRARASLTRPINDQDRRAFAAELRRDEKHMEVTPTIQKIADEVAGTETNPVLVAERFFDYVISKSEHYSKSRSTPAGKCLGDAMECLTGKGDCCTDQHALFIALCRARDIPCRLFYGSRLKPENENTDHDPGYRCWPKFFAPNLGWIPLDISSADTAGDRARDWFGGLDANRLEWSEGRDFELQPRSAVRPDIVIRGWVEVDGQTHSGLKRVVRFTRQEEGREVAAVGAGPR